MEKEKNNRGVIILLTVIIVILAVLCVLFATDTITLKSNTTNNNSGQNTGNTQQETESNNNIENNSIQNELGVNDTFSTSTNSGIVEVIGYPEIKELTNELGDGEHYNYIYFHIKEAKSTEFKNYIESLKGNSFVLENAIGIGCNVDGKITYNNSSDELGDKGYEISQEDSSKILNATENNPVRLKLERLALSYGKGAPVCYSHITKIEVVD